MEIVLNEREWVENMVARRQLGRHPGTMLRRYATYLRQQGYSIKDVRRQLEDYVLRCNPSANHVRWAETVERAIKSSEGRQLIEIDEVPITDSEIKKIQTLVGIMRQKIMFTLLCLAKYRKLANDGSGFWVGCSTSWIFELANVSSYGNGMLILHELCDKGLISHNKIVDNTSLRVNIVDDQSEPVLLVSDFRNLGYQYLRMINRGKYIECTECGLLVPKKSNRQKYCKACAHKANIENTILIRREKAGDGAA